MEQPQQNSVRKPAATISLERIMDVWCCYFLAAGLLAAIYKLLAVESSFPGDFWYWPAIFLLPIFLFRPRWFLVLIACAAVILLVNAINEHSWLNTMLDFMRWWADGFTPANVDFIYYYYLVVRLLLAGAVTLSLWLLIRRRAPFWLLLIACPAVVAVLAYFGLRGFSVSMYLLAAGLLPLAAASAVNRSARGRAALFALPLTLAVLGASMLTLPADTAGWRWQPLGDKVEEWREAARVYYWAWRTRNEPLTAFDLGEEYHVRLGGPIKPGNSRMLMVETNAPLLLKGSVYDYYTGFGWLKSSFSYGNIHVQAAIGPESFNISDDAVPFLSANAEYDLDLILGVIPPPDGDHPLAPFVHEFSAEITLMHPQEPRLFYYGRPYSFSSVDGVEPFLEQNAELKTRLLLYNGYRYELTGLMLDRTKAGFTEAVVKAAQREDASRVRINASQASFSRHLPSSITGEDLTSLYNLTQKIVNDGLAEGESRSPYEQALLLESWLKNNCRYTLTPEIPPENTDFVLHFLQTREGYCTYYATAMVVMARLLNIRARYVTGYSLMSLPGENQYEATQATAHAWVELFFDGVGWLTFDPTGRANYTESREDASNNRLYYEPYRSPYLSGTGVDSPVTDYILTILCAALALLLAALLACILIFRRARLAYELPKLRARFSPGAVLEIYYRDMLGQLDMLGWQRHPEETIIVFAKRIGGYLPSLAQRMREYSAAIATARQLRELAAAVCAWRYGDLPPDQDSLLNAAFLHKYFEGMLRQKFRGGKYYFYRLIHWPKAFLAVRAKQRQV